MAKLPARYIKAAHGNLKRAWSMYRSGRARPAKRKGGKSVPKRKTARRYAGRAYRKARPMFGPGMNYLLGSFGAFVAEDLEGKHVRPWVYEKSGGSLLATGAADLGIGFAANFGANRIKGGRSFLHGVAYTIGGKGIGMIKHKLTGKPGLI